MDRPQLISISLIGAGQKLSVRALVDLTSIKELDVPLLEGSNDAVSPLDNIRFFLKKHLL